MPSGDNSNLSPLKGGAMNTRLTAAFFLISTSAAIGKPATNSFGRAIDVVEDRSLRQKLLAQHKKLSKLEKVEIDEVGTERIRQVLESYSSAVKALDQKYDFSVDDLTFDFDDIKNDRRFCGIVVSGGNSTEGTPRLIVGDDQNKSALGTEDFLVIPVDQELVKISLGTDHRETVWSSRCDPSKKYVSFEIDSLTQQRVVGHGEIQVVSDPEGAKIFLNGSEFRNVTNAELYYPAGTVSLKLVKVGYQTHEEKFELSQDGIHVVNARLQPISE